MDEIQKTPRRLTMAELARLAGVSPSTVSRALSNNPLVNQKTRERVQALAREHNYRINISARNFRLRRSNTIAVVAPSDPTTGHFAADPFVTDLLASIADHAADAGFEILLVKGGEGRDLHADLIAACRADGILAIGGAVPREAIAELRDHHAPIVAWGAAGVEGICCVSTNNYEGGRIVAAHLHRLGRRRFAFVGSEGQPEFARRLEGFRDALRELAGDLADRVAVIDVSPTDEQMGTQLIDALAAHQPDGVFAGSDLLALASVRALAVRGRSVPDDVSVVGYDNIRLAAYGATSLTTVDQQIADGGRHMVECLRRLIAGERCAAPTLKPRLLVRDSCGSRAALAPLA